MCGFYNVSMCVYVGFVMCEFYNVWVSVCGGFLMSCCFGNMCIGIYCVLYCLLCFLYYLFMYIYSYFFVPTSERTTATE